jgi:ketosteroid isomerase-like protein
MNQDIVDVIKAYEKSLNTSDAQAALALYGEDPVFMPEFSAALRGKWKIHRYLFASSNPPSAK